MDFNNYTPYPEYPETNIKKEEPKEKKKKKGGLFKKVLAAVLLGCLFGGCAAGTFFAVNRFIIKDSAFGLNSAEMDELRKNITDVEEYVKNQKVPSTALQATPLAAASNDVTAVVDRVMPSMVSVTNQGEMVTSDWFGRQYKYDTESAGSGIIIGESDTEYFIATNHHVIASSKTLTVMFVDETTAEAYVKGYDASLDIAVIGVAKSSLDASTRMKIQVAELGNSDALRIGEPAIAIGNALGYGQSVTTGVVSAINREMTIEDVTYSSLIQTSAAINPGNSGGALLNVYGQVIGINSSKIASSTVEGMGFAIPITEVRDILKEFSDRETRVKLANEDRGFLGITGTNDDITIFGYPQGAYVVEVTEGGPAASAGIYKGDIITKVDGQTVTNLASLQELLSYYAPGETVSVTLQRLENGAFTEVNLSLTLTTRPQS